MQVVIALFVLLCASLAFAQVPDSRCVRLVNPPGAIGVTGTWSIMANITSPNCRPIHVAGMRGIFPGNNSQVPILDGDMRPRVLQAFQNMLYNAAAAGAGPQDCSEVVVFVQDMISVRPLVNSVQAQLWNPTGINAALTLVYPPRTILQINGFNGLTCRANSGGYYQGTAGPNGQVICDNSSDQPVGDILEVKGTFYIREAEDVAV